MGTWRIEVLLSYLYQQHKKAANFDRYGVSSPVKSPNAHNFPPSSPRLSSKDTSSKMVMDTIAKPNENETVLKVRQFIAERGADGWDKAW